jgi:exodeoxyribonuclease VII small subunit
MLNYSKIQAMAKKPPANTDFEKSLKELESLVEKMEQGDLSLEDSLGHFERGVQLSRACQQALKTAEQKVAILMQKDGHEDTTPFDCESA